MPERLLSTGDVARLLKVTRGTVGVWAKTGLLPSIRTPGGQYRFTVDDIRALMVESGYSLDQLDALMLR